MESTLRKLKLIVDFNFKLKSDKAKFISALIKNVDEADIDSIFPSFFESFSSSENLFKGKVHYSGFHIRKRKRFFDKQFGFAKAKGTFHEENENLVIKGSINVWNNLMFIFFGFILVFYLFFINMMLVGDFSEVGLLGIPFVFIHALLMFGIPFFIMRRNVKRTKQELEREFHFINSKL